MEDVIRSVPAEAKINVRSGLEISNNRRSMFELIAPLSLMGDLLSTSAVVEELWVFSAPPSPTCFSLVLIVDGDDANLLVLEGQILLGRITGSFLLNRKCLGERGVHNGRGRGRSSAVIRCDEIITTVYDHFRPDLVDGIVAPKRRAHPEKQKILRTHKNHGGNV